MTRSLPINAVDLLLGQHEAAKIAESCAVAFWLQDRDNQTALYHLVNIHEMFSLLADKLGYAIAPKVIAPVAEVIA